jgi:glutathione S-transferase
MKLYFNAFSPNARRARIAATEFGVNVTITDVDFAKGENRGPGYLAKNPMGKVPVLEEDDGWMLWESPAILCYWANKHPEKNLLPKQPREYADVMRWMFWYAAHLDSALYGLAVEKVIKPMQKLPTNDARVAAYTEEWNRFAPILNAHLEGKTYVAADTFTIADLHLAPGIDVAPMVGLDLKPYTHLGAWLSRVQARPSWKR